MDTILNPGIAIIKDEWSGEIMRGAKYQTGFDSPGQARSSCVHTCWWEERRMRMAMREIGFASEVDEIETLEKAQRDAWARKDFVNAVLDDKLKKAKQVLRTEMEFKTQDPDYTAEFRKQKIAKDARYVTYTVKSIDIEPVK